MNGEINDMNGSSGILGRRSGASTLTVNTTSESIARPSTTPHLPFRHRSTSTSSLLTSPSSTKKAPSPSTAMMIRSALSKQTSPRATSPTSKTSRLGSPTARTTNHSTPSIQTKPMSTETYFRLLKKTQVLDQLLEVSTYLASQEQELRNLQTHRAKSESIHEYVFQELDTYKHKFVEAQKFLLEIVERMTVLCIKEDALEQGTSTKEAIQLANETSEERVMQDLAGMVKTPSGSEQGSIESRALLALGKARVDHLDSICVRYESLLMKSEIEFSRASHWTYTNECMTKLKQYEENQTKHTTQQLEMSSRMENLKLQNQELHQHLETQREEMMQLQQKHEDVMTQYQTQSDAIEQFGMELKTELKKRYGVIPLGIEQRWQHYFSTYTTLH